MYEMDLKEFVRHWKAVRDLLEELLAKQPRQEYEIRANIRDALLTRLLDELTKLVSTETIR